VPKRSRIAHVILPTLSVAALAYPLYSVIAPGQLFPYNLVAMVVLCWIVAGVALYYYYRARSPGKIAAIGTFVPDAEELPELPAPAPGPERTDAPMTVADEAPGQP
jgi:hypothetical protein